MGKRIVVPTDFSQTSDDALTVAIDYARLLGASIDLIHVNVITAYVLPPPVELVSFVPYNAEILLHVEKALAERADKLRAAGIEHETHILSGSAAEQIARHAESRAADLVVMGTHGRTGIKHVLLGSVAERVVQRSPCPVLVVPAREGRERKAKSG